MPDHANTQAANSGIPGTSSPGTSWYPASCVQAGFWLRLTVSRKADHGTDSSTTGPDYSTVYT